MPEHLRGKYLAFSEQDSAGVRHLKNLQSAGLSHVHLLPSYDYGSVPEREEDQATIKVRCVIRLNMLSHVAVTTELIAQAI